MIVKLILINYKNRDSYLLNKLNLKIKIKLIKLANLVSKIKWNNNLTIISNK